MSAVVDLMNDGEDAPPAAAAAAPVASAVSTEGGQAAKAAAHPAGSGAPAKHAGEMELETPFVEKYRPMFVSRLREAAARIPGRTDASLRCSSRTSSGTRRRSSDLR